MIESSQAAERPLSFPRSMMVVILVLASVYFVWRGPLRAIAENGRDFRSFYSGTRAWFQGSNPYEMHNVEAVFAASGATSAITPLPVLNPPVMFPIMLPFALPTWQNAKTLWAFFQVVLIAVTLALLVYEAGWPVGERLVLGFMAAALALAPLHVTISQGQLGIFVAFCVVLAMFFEARRRDWLVGAMLVLATAIKPQMGIFFLLFALCRLRWRTWASAAIVGTALLTIGVGQMWMHNVDWIASLHDNFQSTFKPGALNDPSTANPSTYLMLNLQYPLNMVLLNSSLANIVALGFAAVVGGFTLWFGRRNGDHRGETLTYAIVAVLTLLAVYHRCYDAVLLLLPLAWAFLSLQTSDRRWAILTIIFTLPFLVPGPTILAVMADAGRIPCVISDSWWWRLIVMPHQVYALVLLEICLLMAAWRNRNTCFAGLRNDFATKAAIPEG